MLTKEEAMIQLLNNKYAQKSTNVVSLYKEDIVKLNLEEKEASRMIHLLAEEEFLIIKTKSIHNDFGRFWELTLKASCIHYFENKNAEKKSKWVSIIAFLIPTIISIIALFT